MFARRIVILYATVACAVAAGLIVSALTARRPRESLRSNPLRNPAGMVDRLVFLDRPEAWEAGSMKLAEIDAKRDVITLAADSSQAFPRRGSWTSAEIAADFPITEVIPSWNASVPADAGMAVSVRVRNARQGGEWSPWLYFGGWGREAAAEKVVRYNHGVVHVDTLVLDRPADTFQVRVDLAAYSFDAAANPAVRRVAVSYSGVIADEAERARLLQPVKIEGTWARRLEVPYRTQGDTPKPLRGETCSPTSVSMVLEYWGYNRPTVENALAIYDAEHEMFGNWNRAVQRAGELGLDAWLTRFRSWDAVKAEIAKGRPVIAAVQFKKGEFPAAAIASTNGHLIVIRGFTPAGDAIVNDPASRDKGNGAVYPAADLARAWFGHGGVGYVIVGKAPIAQAGGR
jgi:Peptidase_C39 like family